MTLSIFYPDFLIPPEKNIDQVLKEIINLLIDKGYNPISFDINSWESKNKNNESYTARKIYLELENLELEETTIKFLNKTKLYKEHEENIRATFDQTILITNIEEKVITKDKLINEIEKLSFNQKQYKIDKKDYGIYINIYDKNYVKTLLDQIAKINKDRNIEIKSQLLRKDKYNVDEFLASNSTVKEDNFSQKSNQKTVEDFYNEQNYEQINILLNTFINDVCVYLSKNTKND